MEYLLVMSLSGSTMTGICLLLRCLSRDKISARLYYLLEKAAVLYYLVPLPFLKKWYGEALRHILPENLAAVYRTPLVWTSYVIHADEKSYVNVYAKLQIVVMSVWILVGVLLILAQLLDYLHTIRRFVSGAAIERTGQTEAVSAVLQKQYGLKRKVTLYQGLDGERTMTFGLFRPIIVCGRDLESREAALLIRHEMVHIARWDILWKILMQLAVFLHWWNPFLWILHHDLERACEWSCDETAMQGRPAEEVKVYLRLLIEEAVRETEKEKASLRWRAGFGNNAKKIKERMENLMRRKKWNRAAAGMLVAVLMFANSMTVFAYRDVVHREVPEEVSQEEIEKMLHRDDFAFIPDGVDAAQDVLDGMEILYDRQFIDGEGNIYPIPDAAIYRGCTHTYVSGTGVDHDKQPDGGCEVITFRAQRCSKCGYVIQGDEISRTYYKVCPH